MAQSSQSNEAIDATDVRIAKIDGKMISGWEDVLKDQHFMNVGEGTKTGMPTPKGTRGPWD